MYLHFTSTGNQRFLGHHFENCQAQGSKEGYLFFKLSFGHRLGINLEAEYLLHTLPERGRLFSRQKVETHFNFINFLFYFQSI